jgi:hypothetical protein
MTVILMSEKELSRLRVFIDVADGKLAVAEAESLLSLLRLQIFRLLERLQSDGPVASHPASVVGAAKGPIRRMLLPERPGR